VTLNQDDLEQMLVFAVAHAVTKTSSQAVFDRAHKQLWSILRRLPDDQVEPLCSAIHTELRFLDRSKLADPGRLAAMRDVQTSAMAR
jgi:hypothetical protein